MRHQSRQTFWGPGRYSDYIPRAGLNGLAGVSPTVFLALVRLACSVHGTSVCSTEILPLL